MDPMKGGNDEGTTSRGVNPATTPLKADRTLAGLRARGVSGDAVRHVEVHDSLPSTNATALEDARAGLVVVALEQIAGRGRSGAQWASPRGGLYLSYAPPAALFPARPTDATLLAGLAVADTVDDLMGGGTPRPVARLKWPNDILLGGAKVAGVLVQARGVPGPGDRDVRSVIGIGMNVNSKVNLPRQGLPGADTVPVPAGCLADALGRALELEPVLVDVVWRLVRRLDRGMTRADVEDYRRRCATLGSRVAFTEGGSRVEALAVDIDVDGALVVEVGGGRKRVTAGEVRHVRDVRKP